MPKLNMDGTPTGEYGNKVFTNNIYDPKIISDKEFINRGIEAANDAKLKPVMEFFREKAQVLTVKK